MNVHPTALVHENARLDPSVVVGPFTVIHDNVVIEAGTVIGSHCELGISTALGDGSPLRIGAGSTIRSHSVFYESSVFGAGLVTGHRVTVRERTQAGDGFQIGTLGDIQGHCRIGTHVRFHSNVHVGQQTQIDDFVWVFPFVVFTNDPHPPSAVVQGIRVRKFAAIATMSTVLPGVTIGEDALIGAGSVVTRDVGDGRIVTGSPASDRGEVGKIKLQDGSGRAAYPWRKHFHRGYPEDLVAGWLSALD